MLSRVLSHCYLSISVRIGCQFVDGAVLRVEFDTSELIVKVVAAGYLILVLRLPLHMIVDVWSDSSVAN